MRSFQRNVGVYQMDKRLLTFHIQMLILHKSATSGVSSSGSELRIQEFLARIRHFAASVMGGVSSCVAWRLFLGDGCVQMYPGTIVRSAR
ncbi:hypothetical protein K443DRAFT_197761 [Laccaria amethystina LaAM-08-1]|uniref:Uncharacterized protein n=1 Tax=Laccaria amethystina LaAM-08-1 TaxID=1095629 RepID=A0A0C9XRZ0_9AGAR|nr:hypothetical protein K443DRAFT_197761 [Laccaria amethystina LaAM-08-1]